MLVDYGSCHIYEKKLRGMSMNVTAVNNSVHAPRNSSIGGIHLPNFNSDYVYSKKQSNITKQAYKRKIEEQAYKDFANGKFQNTSKDFVTLMKQYTSEVSPNREGIIQSGLKAIEKNGKTASQTIDIVLTILEGKITYQQNPSGNCDYIEFYDSNGEMVATFSNNGWTMYTTNAEAARQTEMCTIYNQAWGNAKKGIELSTTESACIHNNESAFDVRA